MLKVNFGSLNNEVYRTFDYFDINFDLSWINTDFAKRAIKEVDGSIVIKDRYIESPYLGAISPLELSGGVKTLLTLESNYEDDKIFNISTCGDNCAKFILELAENRDLFVILHHPMRFPEPFNIEVVNTSNIINNNIDLIYEAENILYDHKSINEFLLREYPKE